MKGLHFAVILLAAALTALWGSPAQGETTTKSIAGCRITITDEPKSGGYDYGDFGYIKWESVITTYTLLEMPEWISSIEAIVHHYSHGTNYGGVPFENDVTSSEYLSRDRKSFSIRRWSQTSESNYGEEKDSEEGEETVLSLKVHLKESAIGKMTVTTSSNDAAAGSTSPERDSYTGHAGEVLTVKLTAAPKAGYKFVRWAASNVKEPTKASTSVDLTVPYGESTSHYEAIFERRSTDDPYDPPVPGGEYDPDGPTPSDPSWPDYAFIAVYIDSDPAGIATDKCVVYAGEPTSPKRLQLTSTLKESERGKYNFTHWTSAEPIFAQGVLDDGNIGIFTALVGFPENAGDTKVVYFTAHYASNIVLRTQSIPSHLGATSPRIVRGLRQGDVCDLFAYTIDDAFFRGWKRIDWKHGDEILAAGKTQNAIDYVIREDDITDGHVRIDAIFHKCTKKILRQLHGNKILISGSGFVVRDGDPD